MPHKISPGGHWSQISASEFNRHVDVSDYFHGKQALGRGGLPQFRTPDTNKVKVVNASGANRRKGEVLEFGDFALSAGEVEQDQLWFQGIAPVMANGFGILVRPIPDGEADDCQVSGACMALVNIIDTSHRFATPVKSLYVLQSAPVGPVRLLFRPEDEGEQKCGVLITGDPTQIVKPAADIEKGQSGTCSIWVNEEDTEAAVNPKALGAPCAADKYAVAYGDYVWPWECD